MRSRNKLRISALVGVSFTLGFVMSWIGVYFLRNDDIQTISGNTRERTPQTRLVADYTFTNVSVLCWVMTSPDRLFERAIHITQTWGPRCNLTLYVTETPPKRPFPGLVLTVPTKSGRFALWEKTRAAFTYIYDHYYDKFDWFVKVDDDTYLIVDNLRYFLSSKDTNEPVYYGYNLKLPDTPGAFKFNLHFSSGGAGYVLGREALYRLITVAFDSELCPEYVQLAKMAEDAMLGFCIRKKGVSVGPSRDTLGRERFLVFQLKDLIYGNLGTWLPKYLVNNFTTGINCCSDYAVSVHYTPPDNMYILEYMTQHFRLATRSRDHNYAIGDRRIPI